MVKLSITPKFCFNVSGNDRLVKFLVLCHIFRFDDIVKFFSLISLSDKELNYKKRAHSYSFGVLNFPLRSDRKEKLGVMEIQFPDRDLGT